MKSPHAKAASLLRQELKKEFPRTKFSIRSQSYAGGSSIHIEWVNGPTSSRVDSIADKYSYGRFDPMTDSYDMTNVIDDLPQVKYVQTRREISADLLESIFQEYKKTHKGWSVFTHMNEFKEGFINEWGFINPYEYIRYELRDKDL